MVAWLLLPFALSVLLGAETFRQVLWICILLAFGVIVIYDVYRPKPDVDRFPYGRWSGFVKRHAGGLALGLVVGHLIFGEKMVAYLSGILMIGIIFLPFVVLSRRLARPREQDI